MRRATLIVLAAVLLAAIGCQRARLIGEELVGPKKKAESNEPRPGEPLIIMPGDRVNIELTIFHPAFMYLTGDSSVTIYAPSVRGLSFRNKEYQLKKPYFPMVIPFVVTNDVDLGNLKLQLPAQLNFAYKADDRKQLKNVLIDVPLKIVAGGNEPRDKAIRAPVEFFLDTKDPIEQVGVQ